MAGQGKYTTYTPYNPDVAASTAKASLLAQLYPGGDISSPVIDLYKQSKDSKFIAGEMAKSGNKYIYGFADPDSNEVTQLAGDLDHFPEGYAPNFTGKGSSLGISSPDKHSNEVGNGTPNPDKTGEPATPFYPDIRSPSGGPGNTDPSDKTGPIPPPLRDPTAYKAGMQIPGGKSPVVDIASSVGTKSPAIEGQNIHASVKLGLPLEKGKSAVKL